MYAGIRRSSLDGYWTLQNLDIKPCTFCHLSSNRYLRGWLAEVPATAGDASLASTSSFTCILFHSKQPVNFYSEKKGKKKKI